MRSPKIDPEVQRDLDALDAALTGERQDLEVAMIADEVRHAAEPMPPGLALRLESAIAEGFAKPAKPRRRSWAWAPALGTLGALVVAIVIAQGGGGGTDALSPNAGDAEVRESSGGSSSSAAAPEAAVTEELSSGGAAYTAAPPNERRVQRAAELTISTPLADLQETSDEVTRTTDRLGGYVQRSDVFAGEESGRATFELRIPSDRLEDALAALSKLGHVQSRTQQSEDITGRFTSARSRLIDARAERAALLRALAAAATEQEIDSIKQRLQIANSRIEAAKGDLFAARRAANYATVSVAVLGADGEDEGGAGGGDDGWTPGQALDDAVDLLSVAAGVLIVALAAAIPAALLLLLVGLAWRAWRKRSRDLVLDGKPV